ncbi:MAG: hypothetical protein SFV15_25810 [Polyangiaceae bacterium]|nr:hypothetical protein [Polyangiaceae bacterium]
MAMSNVIRGVFALVCVAATVGGLRNVFSDNTEVEAQARLAACGATPCSAVITRLERTPFGQDFQLQVSAKTSAEGTGHSVDVKCKRAQILFGAYQCLLTTP